MKLAILMKGLLSIAVVFTALDVAKATVLDDVNAGLAPGETYVDLTSSNAPETGISWNFPDTSDSSHTVNENVADEKGQEANEIDMLLSGLAANTGYNIDVVIFGKNDPGQTFDVAGGFTSGSLTTYLWTDGSQITGDFSGLWRIPLGSVSTDGIGDLHVHLGTGVPFHDGDFDRTEIDGVIYSVVPEPASAVLVLLGACGLAFCQKRK